ncbi:hypothetical protein LCGC14_1668730 [marine sediment metagenome]|uniref:Uncharacterized protein n=1 Tax=marine sediment metagenome TaxID=412755 RepID=A0A0F9K7V3_9ZZZZ
MNRRQLAKNGFLGLCGALLGKKVEAAEPPDAVIQLSYSTEGGPCTMIRFPDHPAGSTEPIPPGWDFLNDKEEDVYNG